MSPVGGGRRAAEGDVARLQPLQEFVLFRRDEAGDGEVREHQQQRRGQDAAAHRDHLRFEGGSFRHRLEMEVDRAAARDRAARGIDGLEDFYKISPRNRRVLARER